MAVAAAGDFPDPDRRLIAGRYRLIALLATGGMGETYRAWDAVARIPVVVKMPKRELRHDKELMTRFAREIQVMRSIAHESIVPIADSGEHEGCPFVVMRFLPGGSLSEYRQRNDSAAPTKNPPGMLHIWLPQIAAALDHIHAKGMLHRDVKPGNIFLDGFLKPFLGDFGIAKVVDDSGGLPKEQTLTATQMAIGTPEYMAPELFRPKVIPDGRVDQYALAVTVYEMLSGEKPFTGSMAHIIVEHSSLPVPPLEKKCKGLPPSACAAVHRALSKTPEERFTTCEEFAMAVLVDIKPLEREADTVRLLCPSCRNILKLPQRTAGKKGRCPRCQSAMDVASDLGSLWLESEEHSEPDAITAGDEIPNARAEQSTPSPTLSWLIFGLGSLLVPVVTTVAFPVGVLAAWLLLTVVHFFGLDSHPFAFATGILCVGLITPIAIIVLSRALASTCRAEHDHQTLYLTSVYIGLAMLALVELVFAFIQFLLDIPIPLTMFRGFLFCVALFVIFWGLPLRFARSTRSIDGGLWLRLSHMPLWCKALGFCVLLALWITWIAYALVVIQRHDVVLASRVVLHPDNLPGLRYLDAASAAWVVSRVEYDRLNLDGVRSIDNAVAVQLAKHRGALSLNGLTTLPDNAAKTLAQHQGYLHLDGLTMLSDETARALGQHEGYLSLNGLTSLSDEAARALGQHKGYLSLNGLTIVTDAQAQALAKHAGSLKLRGLSSLTSSQVQAFATNKDRLELNTSLDKLSQPANAPLSLGGYTNSIGKTFEFRVVGTKNGVVWGSNPYTSDSSLAAAAVHAGAVKSGESAVVRVTVQQGQASYVGSVQNGISSYSYGPWPLSYRVIAPVVSP